jgi:hypothetical protein
MKIFWIACCIFVERLLSKSSWSFVVRAKILPVGVISNHDNGERNNVYINFYWIIFDVSIMNLLKNIPFIYNKIATINDIIA